MQKLRNVRKELKNLKEHCGAPGFLECSTQHIPYFTCYCLDYDIMHLV